MRVKFVNIVSDAQSQPNLCPDRAQVETWELCLLKDMPVMVTKLTRMLVLMLVMTLTVVSNVISLTVNWARSLDRRCGVGLVAGGVVAGGAFFAHRFCLGVVSVQGSRLSPDHLSNFGSWASDPLIRLMTCGPESQQPRSLNEKIHASNGFHRFSYFSTRKLPGKRSKCDGLTQQLPGL